MPYHLFSYAAVYLKSRELDAAMFRLDHSGLASPTSVLEVRLQSVLATRQLTPLVCSHVRLVVTTPGPGHTQGRRKLLEASLAELLVRGGQGAKYPAAFLQGSGCAVIQLARPSNLVVTVEATLLEAQVAASPRIISFLPGPGGEDSVLDLTAGYQLELTAARVCLADLDRDGTVMDGGREAAGIRRLFN